LRDNDNEVFFPITHINAVEGLEGVSLTDINDKITEVNTTLDKANATILEQQKVIDQQTKDIQSLNTGLFAMVDDSGWRDYQVANATKDNGFNGFKCKIRELVVGLSKDKFLRLRTIRVNMSNVPHNTPIAQLPSGFVDETVRFALTSNSGIPAPYISVGTDGVMRAWFDTDHRDGAQNIYGQHTWIVSN
ncbi:hypothetical protein BUY98_12760, partial [Staphylococcus gallinarum]|uniref:hypothetical protein n=1 Tax=Staphylococcus gallinarum TaxID=1293 RepID=UPI000FF85E51